MAVLQITENDPMLSEYYKRLDQFSRKAKEHAAGDEHKYLEFLAAFWSYTTNSDKGLAEVCIDTLKKGIAGKDYALMQAVMHFVDKSDLLWQSANGCDHSYMAYHILPKEKFAEIRMLEYGNFDPGYLNRFLKEELSTESIPQYGEPYEIFNIMLSAPISVMKVHQPYLDSGGSAREKKQYYMDCVISKTI